MVRTWTRTAGAILGTTYGGKSLAYAEKFPDRHPRIELAHPGEDRCILVRHT